MPQKRRNEYIFIWHFIPDPLKSIPSIMSLIRKWHCSSRTYLTDVRHLYTYHSQPRLPKTVLRRVMRLWNLTKQLIIKFLIKIRSR